MAANFPNLIRDINLEIQEAALASNRVNSKISLPTQSVIKLLKAKDKGKKNLESSQSKMIPYLW